MTRLHGLTLVAAAAIVAMVGASAGRAPEHVGVFVCDGKSSGIGRNHPRLEKTGWIGSAFTHGDCSTSYHISRELVPGRSDRLHLIGFGCSDHEAGRKLLLFGGHGFSDGSSVSVTFRVSGKEMVAEGRARASSTIEVALDPDELVVLTHDAGSLPELQIELAQGPDIIHGAVQLNSLITVLEVLHERCR